MDVAERLRSELQLLKTEQRARDDRMNKIATARTPGGLAIVYPDLFPAEGPYREPMVANMVDIAARDISEVIAPLPSISCSASKSANDRARKVAEKRSKIAQGFIKASKLQTEMFSAADRYVSYGFIVGTVRLDFEKKTPVIQFPDPRGCYMNTDQWGNIVRVYWTMKLPTHRARVMFPELIGPLAANFYSNDTIEIIRFQDKDHEGIFTTAVDAPVLKIANNPMGKVMAKLIARPGLLPDQIGQFDDVLAVQVAKARFALLALDGAQKSVQAPLALPSDVQEFSLGPDSIIRSAFPEKIRRVGLDLPPVAFAEQGQLDNELRQGARYPEARGGNVDQSIITGRGVQALMTGFDTQIRTAQAFFADGLEYLFQLAFEADEKIWPNDEKSIQGNDNGTPYEIKYTPSKDIKGDYSVDVQYGLMAGLNPNQALVFGLQARGDKLISRDFLRRQMPFALDATEEEQKVDIEEMRDALKQSVQGYAQSIPALASQGQDPSEILSRMALMIGDRQKGISIEDSVVKAFKPPEQEQLPPGAEMAAMGTGGPGSPGGEGGGLPPGMDAAGLMQGVAPGQQGQAPGGRPDVLSLLAGMGRGGTPNLGATVQRRQAI